MSLFNSPKYRWLVNLLLLIAGVVGIFVSAIWMQHLAKIDPFANKRQIDTQVSTEGWRKVIERRPSTMAPTGLGRVVGAVAAAGLGRVIGAVAAGAL